jgi:hypothetical protein
MTTNELLKVEIDGLDDQSADAVLQFVKQLADSKPIKREGRLLEKLMRIRIQGPPDFSENLDLYLSGEKNVDDHIH